MRIEAFADARAVLARVESQLFAGGAECELLLGLLRRLEREPEAFGPSNVLLVAADDASGEPIAFVMKTGSRPALITGFVADADIAAVKFDELAAALCDARDDVTSLNGAVRWVTPLRAAVVARTGRELVPTMAMRAFELRALVPPPPVAGGFRLATIDDLPALLPFAQGFADEALAPAERGTSYEPALRRWIGGHDLGVWDLGEPVALAAINRRTGRSSTVGFVYTPHAHRRRGYASAVVAALTARELAAGAQYVALFTDAANPTANHIYQALGYEHRVDFQRYDAPT